jgi:thioredoxin 2
MSDGNARRRARAERSDPTIRACGGCGAKNRVSISHLADTGRCGACKAPLPPPGAPIEVDEELFERIVSQVPAPVLVDFWAEWCGPCRMAAPEVHALAREMAGKALVLKVDTEAHPGLAARYRVQSIPNFVLLQNGRVVFQRAGAAPRAEMRRWFDLDGARAKK